MDAAIVFADLLPMLVPMGLDLDYRAGEGPVFANPLRSAAAIERLAVPPAEEGTGYIAETIGRVLGDLPRGVPLIGFAGARSRWRRTPWRGGGRATTGTSSA